MMARHSCGARWVQVASRTGHCCACHRTFGNEDAFTRHRKDGGCLDPARMVKAAKHTFYTRTDSTGAIIWWLTSGRMSDKARQRFKELKA